jgi:hypothetical protein
MNLNNTLNTNPLNKNSEVILEILTRFCQYYITHYQRVSFVPPVPFLNGTRHAKKLLIHHIQL